MNSKDVFISYKSEEFEKAEWVRVALEAEGISCWMAPMCIPGGSNYAREIPKAIKACRVFVLILSRRSQESIWVPKELDQAINAGKEIMPFVIEETLLDDMFGFYLSNVQQYYAFTDWQSVLKTMILDIKKILYPHPVKEEIAEQQISQSLCGLNPAECMEFGRGCVPEYLLAEDKSEKLILNSPLLLITDRVIYSREEIRPLLEKIKSTGAKLVIIAEDFCEDVSFYLFTEKRYGGMEIAAVKAPSHGERQKEMLQDLAILTGGVLFSQTEGKMLADVSLNELGCAECVEIWKEKTRIAGGMGEEEAVERRISQIRKGISRTHSKFEKQKLLERIENLSRGIIRNSVHETETLVVTRKYSNGTYVGTIKSEVPHGKGRMEYITGEVYEGEWKNGMINGTGRFQAADGEQYDGEFAENIFHGHGVKLYLDGSKYDGNWEQGMRHGQGTYESDGNIYNGKWEKDVFVDGKAFVKYSDGSTYEGQWSADMQNGQGIYYAANGNIFDGEWKDHQFISGKCVMKYRDGRIYKGGYSNGNYNGKGHLKYLDGSEYEGGWVNGQRCGEGRCCWPNGTVYEGHWENDIADGYGIRRLGNMQYEGQWKAGKRHGHGTFTYSNGDKHEGEWVNGDPWGEGIYTYSDGAVKKGFFKKDLLWCGNGMLRYENGEVYVGEIDKGKFHGSGWLKKADGTQVEGTFEAGVPHGKAVYTDSQGQQFSCKYNHGKQVMFSMKKI
ncbi:MAG: TIR domain-containing protein [Schaedlerella sp.]|nr:TIR domain-containing protein [Schaedlerella sp.]